MKWIGCKNKEIIELKYYKSVCELKYLFLTEWDMVKEMLKISYISGIFTIPVMQYISRFKPCTILLC